MPISLRRGSSVVFVLFITFAALPAAAQYQTPVLDGTIGVSEYANASGDWLMTWDATYLYVAKTNVTTGNGIVIYVDVDPRSTPAAGTNANGNLTGHNDLWTPASTAFTPNLPFRGDARSLTASGITELRTRDGAGAWTNVTMNSNDVSTFVSGTTHEIRIRWGAMLASLSAPPTSFNWLGFEIRESGFMTESTNTMPPANPGAGNALMPYFFTVASTANGASSSSFGTLQSTWKVSTNDDAGAGSLREALTSSEADSTSSRRFIAFDSAVDVITIATDLPLITRTTTVDGTSHPDWTSDPVVALTTSGPDNGLDFSSAANCVVRGMHFSDRFDGQAVNINGGTGHTIAGNWFGFFELNPGGPQNNNNITIYGSANCTIGGTSAADRNVIARAANRGIEIMNSTNTLVLNNYIGTNTSGLEAQSNILGIFICDVSTGTVIGSAANGNVISGNTVGIVAESPTTIVGNKIGVGSDGTTALANEDNGISFTGSNMTIGTYAAPNIIANNTNAGIIGFNDGGLAIHANSIFQNGAAGVDISNVEEPAPVVSSALISTSGQLTITLSTTSSGATQSLRLDLYDADPSNLSIVQPKTYRATSGCYLGNTLNNIAWNAGAGFSPGDNLVVMITSYSDGICSTVGDGTSEPSATFSAIASTMTTLASSPTKYATPNQNVEITATVSSAAASTPGTVTFTANGGPIAGCENVAVSSNQAQCVTTFATVGTKELGASFTPAILGSPFAPSTASPITINVVRVFNGPGNFSVSGQWTNATLPSSGEPFLINGACTFDSASSGLAYGTMYLNTNASVTWATNHSTALFVTDIVGEGSNAIDMTSGGLLRFSGTFDTTDITFTRGIGTVLLSGTSQAVPAIAYNKLTIVGTSTISGTRTVHGTLELIPGASLTGGTLEMRGASIVNNGSLTPTTLTIPTGVTTSTSTNFGSVGTFTVEGTFSPSASVVVTGNTLNGTGTLNVTGSSFNTQFSFANKTTSTLSVNFIGSTTQHINGGTYGNLTLNNPAGATIDGLAVQNVLTLTAGRMFSSSVPTISVNNPSTSAVVVGAGWIGENVSLARQLAAGTNTYTYHIGLASGPAPVTLTVSLPSVGSALFGAFAPGTFTNLGDPGIDPARDVNVVWRSQLDFDVNALFDLTCSFGGYVDAAANLSTFVLRQNRSGASNGNVTTTATPGPTSITGTGLSRIPGGIHYFLVGNQLIHHYGVSAPSPQTAGTAFTTTVTAQDALNVTVTDHSTTVVTMSSNQSNAEFDSNNNGTFGDNTKTLTNGTFTITTRTATSGTLVITASDANAKTGSASITINPIAGAPASVTATANSTSQVALTWPAVSGATSYEIWRSSLNSAYALINTTSLTTFNDSGLTANRTYMYKVRVAGGTTFSPPDVATTTVFTNAVLTGVAAKAVHITELRTAVNAMRAAAGLAASTYIHDPTITGGTTTIKLVHITALRVELNSARSALGLAPLVYTDPSITVGTTLVKAVHVTELRAGTQ